MPSSPRDAAADRLSSGATRTNNARDGLRGWTLRKPAPQIAGELRGDGGRCEECGLLALKSHHRRDTKPEGARYRLHDNGKAVCVFEVLVTGTVTRRRRRVPPSGFVFEHEPFDDWAHDGLLFAVESADRFEVQAQVVGRSAFVLAEGELVGGDAEDHGDAEEHVEGGLVPAS